MSIANWNPTAFYLIGDYVYDGSATYYVAVADNRNSPPPSAPWVVAVPSATYAQVLSTTTQVLTAANTPQKITYDTSSPLVGITLVGNTGLRVPSAGLYSLFFSAQTDKQLVGVANVNIYASVDGVAVPNSSTYDTTNQNLNSVSAANLLLPLTAGQVVELWVSSASAPGDAQLLAIPAGANGPLAPSIITTLTRIA